MNGPTLTDAQISQALRAHLPERAQAGLRERILEAAETTAQQRALPSFLGALSDADPVARRRSLLIAAALLVALAFASAAAVGALRLLQRDPSTELSLEPPADLPAFVLSSYERLPQLPPVAFTWRDSDSAKGRIYVDRSGRSDSIGSHQPMRPSLPATRSSATTASAGWRSSSPRRSGSNRATRPSKTTRGCSSGPSSICRRWAGLRDGRDPSEVGNGTAATGWRYVGVEYVAGRPTHHVACVGELSLDIDLWLDIETRLILRSGSRWPMTRISPSRASSQPPRSPRSHSASSRQRCSNRQRASLECRGGVRRVPLRASVSPTSRSGSASRECFDTDGSGGYAAARRPLRCPPCVPPALAVPPVRAADRSTRVDPGKSEGGLARACPP